MKQLLWIAAIVFMATLATVAGADEKTAELAPVVPMSLEGSSIEVGFSQDDEPEPHMLVVYEAGQAKLFQLEPRTKAEDRRAARQPSSAPAAEQTKVMLPETYAKRLTQAVETEKFFTAPQPRAKRCKDRYILRVKQGDKFRERRGCSMQADDPYAAFAQNIFRDAFTVWNKAK